MNKMNKKGFTLIEMLVVIAIIAVLVSIIIPTVTSATDKAEAASIAANLRSVKAEIVTAMLSGDTTSNSHWVFTDSNSDGKPESVNPAGTYTVPFDTPANFWAVITDSNVTVYYEGHTIAYWADLAEGVENSETAATKAS